MTRNDNKVNPMTDAEHIAFTLLAVAGVENPTQEQVTEMTMQWLRHTKAQRASVKFLEHQVAELRKENFTLAAHQCVKGSGDEHGNFRCCCQVN